MSKRSSRNEPGFSSTSVQGSFDGSHPFEKIEPKKKFSPILIIALLLHALSFSVLLVWFASTETQRVQMREFLRQAISGNIDLTILEKTKFEGLISFSAPFDDGLISKTESGLEKKGSPVVSNLKKTDSTKYLAGHSYSPICQKKIISSMQTKKIFEWKDNKGQKHLSDRFPTTNEYHDLRVNNHSIKKYFNLSIDNRFSALPAFTSDQIKREINEIYRILRERVGIAEINPVHIKIRFFDNKKQFSLLRSKSKLLDDSVIGFYDQLKNEAAIYTGRNDKQMYAVARHEITHGIADQSFGNVPVWLNEGMAEYFEQLNFEDFTTRIIEVNKGHLNKLNNMKLPRLKSYLSLTPSQWYAKEGKEDRYALSWSLFHYLMLKGEGKQLLRSMFNHLAANYCKPFSDIEYINRNYPGGIDALDKNWRIWLRSGKVLSHVF